MASLMLLSAHTLRPPALLLAASLLAVACGGGGGGSGGGGNTPPPASATPPPAANAAPEAVATGPQSVEGGTLVTLDGADSNDPDGEISSYSWTQLDGPDVALTGVDAIEASFTAPDVASDTDLQFELQVTDDDGAMNSATVSVTVLAPPPPPPPSVTLTGAVVATEILVADSDVNNPVADYTENDSFDTAQPLPNPATVGGYVNQPRTGSGGRSRLSGDLDDYYIVDLLGGQGVTMLVADVNLADADLYLYDLQGQIVDFSVSSDEVETVRAPSNGTYVVDVFAFGGATNYTLAVGTSNFATSARAEFVPGQAVIRFSNNGARSQAGSSMNLKVTAEAVKRAGLAAFGSPSTGASTVRQRLGTAFDRIPQFADDALRSQWNTMMTIKSLSRMPGVEFAEPNYRVRTSALPNDEAFGFQWHYSLIDLPNAWDFGTGDPNLIVAVVDTGILSGHPDLAGQLVGGYDFIRDPSRASDGDGIDPDPEDLGDGGLGPSSYHGTHVAGTVAARSDNGIGVSGVAWNVKLMPMRALGIDGGTSYDVAQAVRYAAGLPNDSGSVPERRADIINLSLGGEGFSLQAQALYREVREAGVFVVAAAGNEASSVPSYPASYDGVISVAAVDIQGVRARYSNFGSTVDVAAPGGDNSRDLNGDGYPDGVLSTSGSEEQPNVDYVYTFQNGTSMASPHMAGVIALMLSANPDLTPGDFDALLALGALTDDRGPTGRDDEYGYGLINASRAVAAALEASGNPPAAIPRLSSSATTLSFSGGVERLEFTLRNAGDGDLTVESVRDDSNWLSISPLEIDDNGLGRYTARVDRDVLDPGIYSGEILARSAANDVSIRVFASVSESDRSGDVGYLYVLLVDPATGETVGQAEGIAFEGRYNFSFTDIPPGNYELFAGTDADNDFLICDAGEACGAFLTLDQPVLIDAGQDLENLEFSVEFLVNIPEVSASNDTPSSHLERARLPVSVESQVQ